MSISAQQQRAARFVGGGLATLGYQQITDLLAADSLTVPAGAKIAVINPEDQQVRWRDDGTSPTATVGMVIPAGDYYIYTGNLAAIEFIQETASAKLNVSYYS